MAAPFASVATGSVASVSARSCLIGGDCRGIVDPDAPLALCERHLAVASEWAHRADGVEDVLPGPCAACGSRLGIRHPGAWVCAVCEWRFGDVADGELPAPRIDIVYYLGYADRVKIGTTVNPRRRFAAIRHDDVLAFERGGRSLERLRHAQFAEERFGGSEWFAASPALSAHIEAVRGGVPPWDVHARWRSEALALRV